MKERPILFSGPMVRAILDGRKTMTRRVIKNVPEILMTGKAIPELMGAYKKAWVTTCPYGQPGDRLWVREKWACLDPTKRTRVLYAVDRGPKDYLWHSPIFMPRWASRLTREITAVRVERVQDITEEDAWAEGFNDDDGYSSARMWFMNIWDSINAKRGYGWDANPWVWVISFKRIRGVPQ